MSSKKEKHRTLPTHPDAEPAPKQGKDPGEAENVSQGARWMAALCYLNILILIPACCKWRHDDFVKFHLNQGLVLLMLATVCAALGLAPYMGEVSLTLTLFVDVLSLVGLIGALRRRRDLLPLVGKMAMNFHPFE